MATGSGVPQSIKTVAEFVGVTAGGGAGFAALAFGIGYLATKHHDAMLGVPTITTDQTTYVRTGALFFSQTLHDVVAFIASMTPWMIVVFAVVLVGGLVWQWKRASWATKLTWNVRPGFAAVLVSVLVLIGCLITLPYHLAALDPGNKNMLFERRQVAGSAAHVNTALRSVNGEADLHRLYGWQWTRILLLALGLYGARRLVEDALTVQPTGTDVVPRAALEISRRLVHPATAGALVAMLATTPANYGVLAMSTSLPCVQLWQAAEKELGEPGFLFSDLSSQQAKVAILRWDTDKRAYFVDFHARDSLRLMEVHACGVRNPINRIIGG